MAVFSSFLLIWFEGNVEKAFATVATEQDEFSSWHRDKLREVTGIDLNNPPTEPGPELLLDWRARAKPPARGRPRSTGRTAANTGRCARYLPGSVSAASR